MRSDCIGGRLLVALAAVLVEVGRLERTYIWAGSGAIGLPMRLGVEVGTLGPLRRSRLGLVAGVGGGACGGCWLCSCSWDCRWGLVAGVGGGACCGCWLCSFSWDCRWGLGRVWWWDCSWGCRWGSCRVRVGYLSAAAAV